MADRERRQLDLERAAKPGSELFGIERAGSARSTPPRQDFEHEAGHEQDRVDRSQDVEGLVGPPIWGTTKYSTTKPTSKSSARWRTVAGASVPFFPGVLGDLLAACSHEASPGVAPNG